ncbi:hypothetical protein ACVNPS_08085 [Candidatus Bipolaricaulota sp. J31]
MRLYLDELCTLLMRASFFGAGGDGSVEEGLALLKPLRAVTIVPAPIYRGTRNPTPCPILRRLG